MQTEVLFALGGFLLGGLMVRTLMVLSERRAIRSHDAEQHYVPARRAIQRHLQAHGTVNVAQAAQILAISADVATMYLLHMQRDGLVKFQQHKGSGGFYTFA